MNRDIYRAAVDDIKINEKVIKELAIKMKEKPKRNIGRFSILAAGMAFLIVAAVFLNRNGMFGGQKIAKLIPGESVVLSGSRGTIYINKLEGIVSGKLFIPEGSTSRDYTMEELSELFRRDPMPKLPEGFKPLINGTNITFGPDGKMLFMSSLSYSSDIDNPDAPSIDIKLNQNELPPKDCIYASDAVESLIGSTKVVIGAVTIEDKFDEAGKPNEFYDLYTAEFIHKGIGYNITAKKIDGGTFINLINNIIFDSEK